MESAKRIKRSCGTLSLFLAITFCSATYGLMNPAVAAESQVTHPRLITQPIDETKKIAIVGSVPTQANAKNDRGRVNDDFPLAHMLLVLKRSQEQEVALKQFMDEQKDVSSPNYHHWLNAQEFGERYGLAENDVEAITKWLTTGGFTVNKVLTNGVAIDFSGTAGLVRKHMGVEIHALNVDGVDHIANMSDPQIPAALAPAITGIASMHDFFPKPAYSFPPGSNGYPLHIATPADLATIYNLTSLFQAGYSGQGQTIATINDFNMPISTDWTAFRSTYGLSGFTAGSMTVVHPGGCADPGNGTGPSYLEPLMDPQMVTVSAPSATILAASCQNGTTTSGLLLAMQGLINQASPPDIISVSYQIVEQGYASYLAAFVSAYQQAVAEGISIFVSSGDLGGSSGDWVYGFSVNGFASTPYNVAVGGTQFYGTWVDGTAGTSWSSTNSATYGSALSYVPELAWNTSCANSQSASFRGFPATYGSAGACNSYDSSYDPRQNFAGGGGPSICATGQPSSSSPYIGTCAGWPKPAWQTAVGNPNDGVRDLPDVSLAAWSIAMCNNGCGSTPNGIGGGTSASAPLMAGIQALINQKTASRWGNPAPIYYQLAASQYNTSGSATCDSNSSSGVSASCIFNDITKGNTDYPCRGSFDCYYGTPASGNYGVLSLSATSYQPVYPATAGWDFATGLGSVNAYNLANAWPNASNVVTPSAGTNGTISPTAPVSVNYGSTTTFTVTPNAGYIAIVGGTCGGSLSGTTYTTKPVTANCTVVATFVSLTTLATVTSILLDDDQYDLSVSTSSSGAVTSTDGGINCGTTCGASYDEGASVTLTATPAAGHSFTGWSGACTGGSSSCTVAMTKALSATATFN